MNYISPRRFAVAVVGFALIAGGVAAAPPVSSTPIEGLRDASPRTHALVGGRIVVAPGQVIERGTLVLRDGLIVAVGAEVATPSDARVWEMSGRTLYAGFIELQSHAFLPTAWKPAPVGPRTPAAVTAALAAAATPTGGADAGARAWNPRVTPERSAARALAPDLKAAEGLRALGFTAANLAPARGIFPGSSAVVSLGDVLDNRAVIRAEAAQQLAFEFWSEFGRGYPSSLMGAVALVRQTLSDAQWYAAAQAAFAAGGVAGLERPESNASLAALAAVTRGEQPVFFTVRDELDVERALALRREFGLKLTLVGRGSEYRVVGALQGAGATVVVPLTFPEAPAIETLALALDVQLDQLQHWDLARANAGLLVRAGVPVALTSAGLKKAKDFWPNLRKAVAAGLSAEAALAGLTTVPAQLLGTTQLGTLEAGRAAHIVVADGDLFTSEEAAIALLWVDGQAYPQPAWDRLDARGTWLATWAGATGPETFRLTGKTPAKLTGQAGTTKLSVVAQADTLMIFAPVALFGAAPGDTGTVRLSARGKADGIEGTGELPDGREFRWSARRTVAAAAAPAGAAEERTETEARAAKVETEMAKSPIARADVFPAGAYGRRGIPEQASRVLFKNATLWTSAAAGTLERADLLVENGRIKQVGANLIAAPGTTVVDATGKHISAGLIDCHSHVAMDKGWNEGTSAVTCEVRVGDIVDATDIDIYRQLASGVTTINILHGSANPIGGQNQVIKLRWGQRAEGLKFEGAKPGVKFALGENVTRANAANLRGRYPLSRMGVGEIMRDTFARAAEYERDLAAMRAGRGGLPVRRDLRLEAAAEILRGDRVIHIHSYRQDEVLMFVRLAQELKLPVATFQHILEGYKVAPEIAALGAGASMFSDWWAFKFEVYDAIPWNGALMRDAGVLVSFNSDDAELARRLNTEAAKAVKYGGVPPAEALQFVTLNPAKQLRLQERVGSLEPGKDADFVVWSGPPLSTLSRVEQTWIDGRRYFSLEDDAAMRAADAAERAALIQRAIAARQRVLIAGGPGEEPEAAAAEAKPAVLRQLEQLLFGHAHYRDIYHNGRSTDGCSNDFGNL